MMSTALFAQRDRPALEAGLLLGRRPLHKVEAAYRRNGARITASVTPKTPACNQAA
jgi:hypothetical protein